MERNMIFHMLKIKNKDVQKYQLMHEKVKHYGQGRF